MTKLIGKYPLIRLIIPVLTGMVGAILLYGILPFCHLACAILMATLTATLFFLLRGGKPWAKTAFSVTAFTLCATFGYTIESRSIEKAEAAHPHTWRKEIYRDNPFRSELAAKMQERLHRTYISHGITGTEGSIIEAMTIGWRQDIPKDVKAQFSGAGISHILAISGFHVTIVYLLLQLIFLRRITTYRWRHISNMLTFFALWAYAFVTGMQPSLVRAVIMCSMLILTNSIGQKTSTSHTCMLTALIMLTLNPLLLFHIGFLLSFSAVAGICTLGLPLCRRLSISRKSGDSMIRSAAKKLANQTMSLILISASCNIFTLPLIACTFHQLPLLSILSNLLTTITVTLLLWLTPLWWATVPFTQSNMIMTSALKWLAGLTHSVSQHISSLPLAVYPCSPTICETILLSSIIITGTFCLHRRNTKSTSVFLLTIIAYCSVTILRKLTS